MNNVLKRAEKEFKKRGGVVVNRDPVSTVFRLPGGFRHTVNRNQSLKSLKEQLARLDDQDDSLRRFAAAHDAPKVDPDKVKPSRHFMERRDLMFDQGLTSDELTAVLLNPAETRYSHDEQSWLYLRDRVAVVVSFVDVQLLVTCMWTKHSLWALNPRPEDAVAR